MFRNTYFDFKPIKDMPFNRFMQMLLRNLNVCDGGIILYYEWHNTVEKEYCSLFYLKNWRSFFSLDKNSAF